ncbi:MAG: Ca-activated chloride channel [Chthoniobacter sp.]|jgi:Ca-activated chloride channel family protein|nr:Ca-activated chloride channel [Chthoniobacter sp.]
MNLDDPKLTAYALDELDPAERAEIEQLLRENPEALAEVEETERLAARLRRELQAEPSAPLTAGQRAEVLAIMDPAAPGRNGPAAVTSSAKIVPMRRWRQPLALAAGFALLAGVAAIVLQSRPTGGLHRSRLAQLEASPAPAVPSPATTTAQTKALGEGEERSATTSTEIRADIASAGQPPAELLPLAEPMPKTPALAGQNVPPADALASLDLSKASPAAPSEPVSKLSEEAERYYQSGRLDLALKRSEQILAVDPGNRDARKVQDKVSQAIDEYAAAVHSQVGTKELKDLEVAWNSPIGRSNPLVGSAASPALAPTTAPAAAAEAPVAEGDGKPAGNKRGAVIENEGRLAVSPPAPKPVAPPRQAPTSMTLSTGTVGTQPLTASNGSGSLAISQNAIDALLFRTPEPSGGDRTTFAPKGKGDAAGPATAGEGATSPATQSISGVFTDPKFQIVVRALNQKKPGDEAGPVTRDAGKRSAPAQDSPRPTAAPAKPAAATAVTKSATGVLSNPEPAADLDHARKFAKLELEKRIAPAIPILEEAKKLDAEISRGDLSTAEKEGKVRLRAEKTAKLKELEAEIRTFQASHEAEFKEQSGPAQPFAAVAAVPAAPGFASRLMVDSDRGFPPGTEIKDPRTGQTFVIGEEDAGKSLGEIRRAREAGNTEAYDAITDNAFLAVHGNPLSTFSIDVDTASYANVRRFLNQQRLPPKGAVRIEELINYFDYDYPQPEGDAPFSATMEVATCPWQPEHRLVRIGLKGREIARDRRPASNLVFLIDVSGSMQPANKLPLLKKSLGLLVDQLTPEDTVSIAVYAGASGCVLEPTNKKSEIRRALNKLESGGSTNGASGIQLAYQLAERSFIKGGANRVILATDGDFNVGVTNQSELVELIEKKAKSGVFLTVLGFGMDNLKDSTLEKLADKGNGNYAYIDTLLEGKKVLVDQMSGTLVTIAKDVKIQVEFNPAQVAAYRLIGYENRMLKKEDFNDDTKDAGEIGAGHTVTALYEVVPAGKDAPGSPAVDPLKYQRAAKERAEAERAVEETIRRIDEEAAIANRRVSGEPPQPSASGEMLTLKLRYKAPDGDTSKLLEFPLTDDGRTWERSSRDFRFAAAVASFGMLLRESPHKGAANWNSTLELAVEGKGDDRNGYRAEFVGLLERAKAAAR